MLDTLTQIGNSMEPLNYVFTSRDVTLFKTDDCTGESAIVSAGENGLGLVKYNEDALSLLNFSRGEIASLRVPFGTSIDLFAEDEEVGSGRTFVGSEYLASDGQVECSKVNF